MKKLLAAALTGGIFALIVVAQFPPARKHTPNQSKIVTALVPATGSTTTASKFEMEIKGSERIIQANGIPNHKVGAFPNRGNPHRIAPQRYYYRIPAKPELSGRITPLELGNFGIAVNGVPFDPGAAEWYLGVRNSEWRYEALSDAVPLGIDANYAHVQPTGAYHYHGVPTGLMTVLKVRPDQHSPIIGWAADGFPIYALYGYSKSDSAQSAIVTLKSSYRVKLGTRPTGRGAPGGRYDGTFTADYEYVKDLGDLDECNGRFCVTPDFPEGTYAYFLTKDWPIIPRAYHGKPSNDFQRKKLPPKGKK
ncbi:MAG: YHYH protein [Zavarzinella sp.]